MELVEGVHKLAVLRANAIGDYLVSLPAIQALRAAYPAAELVLLGVGWHAGFLAGSYVAWTWVICVVTRGIGVFRKAVFWLREREWDHRLDELESLALGGGRGGEFLGAHAGRVGEGDVVAGEGGQVLQQRGEAVGWGAVGQLAA